VERRMVFALVESKKFFEIRLRLPNPESILYVITLAALLLIFIYLINPRLVAPTRVKPIYRDYVPRYFSDFISLFYSMLVVHSAFKPLWFIFWPLLFYCIGKKFLRKKAMKYFLAVLGFLFAYSFYILPNHSLVPLLFVYKPADFTIDQEFPKACEQKNLIVFAPPGVYLLNPELDVYVKFKDFYSKYVSQPLYYVCVGNGTSAIVGSSEWNYEKLFCPESIKIAISTEKYNQALNNPHSLFPMFVFDCKYALYPHLPAGNEKEWKDIFCFFSGFKSFKCFLHFLNPSAGVFLPPKSLLVE
jgi:uncharacterized protein Usg